MADIYRKSVLDKLSSPEQLDKMVVITPPSFWLALVGGFLIVAVALVWSLFSTLPDKVEASGIYIPEQGSYAFASEVTGIVDDVRVKVGDEVSENDVLFTIDADSLIEEKKKLEERLAIVEAITLDSDVSKDVSNQDTQNLISLKAQVSAAGINPAYSAYAVALNAYNSAHNDTENAKVALTNAENLYSVALAKVNETESAAIIENLTKLNTAVETLQYISSCYGDVETYKAEYTAAQAEYNAAKTAYDEAVAAGKPEEELAPLREAMNLAEAKMNTAQINQTTAETVLTSAKASWHGTESVADKASTDAALASYTVQYQEYKNQCDNNEAYSGNALLAKLKAGYDEAANAYSNAATIEAQYQSSVVSYEASSASQASSSWAQYKTYSQQFTAAKGSAVDQFKTEIEKYNSQIEDSEIRATMDGVITSLEVVKGSAIQQGYNAYVIRQIGDDDRVILYVPISDGKKITEGMKMNVYPSTVDKQEYGHMEATVSSVSEYVATDTEMFDKIGDEEIVSAFKQNGPVIEVSCSLKMDDSTASGYFWSTDKGSEVELTSGTVVSADIIISEKHPISLLLPFIKDTLENLPNKDAKS